MRCLLIKIWNPCMRNVSVLIKRSFKRVQSAWVTIIPYLCCKSALLHHHWWLYRSQWSDDGQSLILYPGGNNLLRSNPTYPHQYHYVYLPQSTKKQHGWKVQEIAFSPKHWLTAISFIKRWHKFDDMEYTDYQDITTSFRFTSYKKLFPPSLPL